MILKIYNGKVRGFGGTVEGGFVQLGFKFRKYMYHFKGAKLAILLCLILHSDEEGHSFPGYDLIEKETGFQSDAINTAIDDLCNMSIDDQRILLRYRVHDKSGKFVGGNHYIVFPFEKELTKFDKVDSIKEPHSEKPKVDNSPDFAFPEFGKNRIWENKAEEEPYIKNNHSLRKATYIDILQRDSIKIKPKKKSKFECHPEDIPNLNKPI